MSLNTFAAEHRTKLFDELLQGRPPSFGEYSEELLKEGKAKGQPQMGSTHYEPDALFFEFIYPEHHGVATVLVVKMQAPERIVFLPVPEWVIESIWQGEIDGSYHFEGDASRLLSGLQGELEPAANKKWFGKREPKRRE